MKKSLIIIASIIAVAGITLFSANTISAASEKAKVFNKGICNARQRKSVNIYRFYNKQQDRIIANYQRKVSRFESWANQYSDQGKDVTELRADIETLKTKINTLKTDIENLKTKTNEYKNTNCTDQETAKQKYTEIADLEKKLKLDKRDIEAFIRSDINPDLKAIKVTITPTVTPSPTSTP